MGFLDNVKDAFKDRVSTHASRSQQAAAKARKPDVPPASTDAPAPAPSETPPAKFETYTVKSGDSLIEIGGRFGVSPQEIAELNNIENPDLIYPGQVFRIPRN